MAEREIAVQHVGYAHSMEVVRGARQARRPECTDRCGALPAGAKGGRMGRAQAPAWLDVDHDDAFHDKPGVGPQAVTPGLAFAARHRGPTVRTFEQKKDPEGSFFLFKATASLKNVISWQPVLPLSLALQL